MKIKFFSYVAVIALGSAMCFASASLAGDAGKTSSSAKPAAAKKTVPGKSAAVENDDVVQKKLDEFASTTVNSLNKYRLDGETRKQVEMVNGQYVARYCSIDRNSIQTSFKKPEFSNAITYVGYMKYHEVDYESSGKTKEEALAGPFKEVGRQGMTELIKYLKGHWTY